MSAATFHTGLCSVLAQRSHRALTTAESARCMAPFSGPIHRTCPSETRYRHVWPQLEVNDSRGWSTRSGARLLMAAQTTSFPRPIVKDWLSQPSDWQHRGNENRKAAHHAMTSEVRVGLQDAVSSWKVNCSVHGIRPSVVQWCLHSHRYQISKEMISLSIEQPKTHRKSHVQRDNAFYSHHGCPSECLSFVIKESQYTWDSWVAWSTSDRETFEYTFSWITFPYLRNISTTVASEWIRQLIGLHKAWVGHLQQWGQWRVYFYQRRYPELGFYQIKFTRDAPLAASGSLTVTPSNQSS